MANIEALQREIFHVQRELIRERMRCKALEEELETPMNIHRWRKLEGRCVLSITAEVVTPQQRPGYV